MCVPFLIGEGVDLGGGEVCGGYIEEQGEGNPHVGCNTQEKNKFQKHLVSFKENNKEKPKNMENIRTQLLR